MSDKEVISALSGHTLVATAEEMAQAFATIYQNLPNPYDRYNSFPQQYADASQMRIISPEIMKFELAKEIYAQALKKSYGDLT